MSEINCAVMEVDKSCGGESEGDGLKKEMGIGYGGGSER